MTRRPANPPLFDVPAAPPRGRGRHERTVNASIRAATDDGILDDVHGGIAASLRALSRSLDSAELADDSGAVVSVVRELRATLDAARMLPRRADVADPFASLLDDLATDDASRA